jgi:ABC-type dipeptide/oligopeptide/nickel transport system permease subunit
LGDGRSLGDSVGAAIILGAVFGILSAVFGKRVFDFFMSFPW